MWWQSPPQLAFTLALLASLEKYLLKNSNLAFIRKLSEVVVTTTPDRIPRRHLAHLDNLVARNTGGIVMQAKAQIGMVPAHRLVTFQEERDTHRAFREQLEAIENHARKARQDALFGGLAGETRKIAVRIDDEIVKAAATSRGSEFSFRVDHLERAHGLRRGEAHGKPVDDAFSGGVLAAWQANQLSLALQGYRVNGTPTAEDHYYGGSPTLVASVAIDTSSFTRG